MFLECTCPPGHTAATGEHHDECSHSNLDANLACAPGSDCCAEDHDHAAAANACPGGHEDACPEPKTCRVWRDATADARHPMYAGRHPLLGVEHGPDDPVPDCPGGHCHKDIKDCTVCRPLIITMLPGSAAVQAVPVAGV